MSSSIEWLANLTKEEQEKVLLSLSNAPELVALEVDGTIYHVPDAVVNLIDSLWMQLQNDRDAFEKN